jgi:hypothetical protein
MENEPYNSDDPKKVKKAKQDARFLEDKKRRGILHICENSDARYVLSLFFEEARIWHADSKIQTPDHVFEHGREAGLRQAGLWWLTNTLLYDPELVSKINSDSN